MLGRLELDKFETKGKTERFLYITMSKPGTYGRSIEISLTKDEYKELEGLLKWKTGEKN